MPAARSRRLRAVGRLLTLIVIGLVAVYLRILGPAEGLGQATMMLGLLLLAAFLAGELTRELKLPRITGYLLAGIAFGPEVLGLMQPASVEDFKLIDAIALSIIAMQAGGELRLERIRARLRGIGAIVILQVVLVGLGTIGLAYLARDLIPILAGQPTRLALAVALIFGLVAIPTSPAATVAVITELRAQGPVSDTVLGVAVLKDVVVLFLIAAVIPLAVTLADPTQSFDRGELGKITIGLAASLAAGLAVGWAVGLYLRRVHHYSALFVLAVAFLIVEVSYWLELEYIVLSLVAGIVIQNFTLQGKGFIAALEANSLPLYALFFALAGASLALSVVPSVWQIMALLILLRGVLIFASTRIGAALTGEPVGVRRHAWLGFTAQAGVTLGIASMISEQLGALGMQIASIVIAMIAVHELVGPPLFRLAVQLSGEIGTPQPEAEDGSAD